MAEHSYSWKCSTQCTCGSYSGQLSYEYIKNHCSAVAQPGFSSTCGGHRTRDNNRLPSENIQKLTGDIKTNNINTIRNMINQEINDRKNNLHYGDLSQLDSNEILSQYLNKKSLITPTYSNEMITVLKNLNEFCNSSQKTNQDNDNLDSNIGNLEKMQEQTLITNNQIKKIQDTIKKAVTDCICYSDCNSFSVCNCYGYCNCNY